MRDMYDKCGVPYPTEGSYALNGWVNTQCPYCESTSALLGFNEEGKYFNCWKCGAHPLIPTIHKLFPSHEVHNVLQKIKGAKLTFKKPRQFAKKCILPFGTTELTSVHKKYLAKRGFNADELVNVWGIKATTKAGIWGNRIIIPIYYNGELVSYQGRDITDKAKSKYLTARPTEEAYFHKHTVYGHDQALGKSKILVTEGVTDVWNFGVGAVCTFGIDYSKEQVMCLSRWKKIVVCFDEGNKAQERAEELADCLSILGCSVDIAVITGDLGEMSALDISKLKRRLGL